MHLLLLLVVSVCVREAVSGEDVQSNVTDPEFLVCPFRDEDPCECTIKNDTSLTFTIVCRYMKGNDLNIMMDKVRKANVSVQTLFLYRSQMVLPKTNLFQNLAFSHVYFTDCKVDSPPSGSYDSSQAILGGMEQSLKELFFRNSDVPGLNSNACSLGTFSLLRKLSLSGVRLTTMPGDVNSCSYYQLEDLYLYNNSIQELTRYSMSRMEKLAIFNMNHNSISVIDRESFPYPASFLTEIHLRYNDIVTLPWDMFSAMPSLRMVDLSHNKISILPANMWTSFWDTLPDVYLDGNNIGCDCSLDWMAHFEQALNHTSRSRRFLTGTCHDPKNNSITSPLDDLDITDLYCSA